MNKEKSGGDMTIGHSSGVYPVDAYKEHMKSTDQYHVLREGFFAGGRQLGKTGYTHGPDYDTHRAQHEEMMRFQKHQERMAAIVAKQEEEDLLILLIL